MWKGEREEGGWKEQIKNGSDEWGQETPETSL